MRPLPGGDVNARSEAETGAIPPPPGVLLPALASTCRGKSDRSHFLVLLVHRVRNLALRRPKNDPGYDIGARTADKNTNNRGVGQQAGLSYRYYQVPRGLQLRLRVPLCKEIILAILPILRQQPGREQPGHRVEAGVVSFPTSSKRITTSPQPISSR